MMQKTAIHYRLLRQLAFNTSLNIVWETQQCASCTTKINLPSSATEWFYSCTIL